MQYKQCSHFCIEYFNFQNNFKIFFQSDTDLFSLQIIISIIKKQNLAAQQCKLSQVTFIYIALFTIQTVQSSFTEITGK